MILARSVESFYHSHKKQIIELLLSEKLKPASHSELEIIGREDDEGNFIPFLDEKGRRFYRFPKMMAIPVDRLGMMMKFTQFLSMGLSPDEMTKIIDGIATALDDGIRNPGKSAGAKIGSFVEEIRKRIGMCFHTEIFYNLLAIQFIREDESPVKFDNEIQMEKVTSFGQGITAERAYFFFQQPELRKLTDFSKMSAQDVMNLLNESKEQAITLAKSISLIREYSPISEPGKKNGSNP